jgi:hypothetical protein
MRRWALAGFTAVVLAVGPVAAQDMHPAGKVWLLWSQHASTAQQLWWRTEAGPFTDAACRAELKRASSRPKVGFTKWYDVTPQHLEKLYGMAATPDRGTWIACWPAPFDFDRDLVEQ